MNKLLLTLSLILALVVPGFSQTATTQTILSAAITTATGTTVQVASSSGMAASTQNLQTYIWVDGEFMKVQAIPASGVLTVARGQQTRATVHPTASVVWYGTFGTSGGPSPFISQNPFPGSNCTSTAYTYLPLINVRDGTLSNCLTSARGGIWVAFNQQNWAFGHPVVQIPDTAYTATLADEYVIATITTARTITLPAITGITGKIIVIKHDGNTATLTVATSAAQYVSTVGTTSISLLNGATTKLISKKATSGAWGWATID